MVVDMMGSLSVFTAFCRASCVLGGSGSWAGVRRPRVGGKGGGFCVGGVSCGVGTSGIGERFELGRGGGVTKVVTWPVSSWEVPSGVVSLSMLVCIRSISATMLPIWFVSMLMEAVDSAW
jgi:hypothetical protein